MSDDSLWKTRFLLFMAARLFGLAIFFLGIAIIYTDLLRDGGWPAVGAILAILGAIDAMFAPRLLKTMWAREDSARHGSGE